jgi:hypothetical protein
MCGESPLFYPHARNPPRAAGKCSVWLQSADHCLGLAVVGCSPARSAAPSAQSCRHLPNHIVSPWLPNRAAIFLITSPAYRTPPQSRHPAPTSRIWPPTQPTPTPSQLAPLDWPFRCFFLWSHRPAPSLRFFFFHHPGSTLSQAVLIQGTYLLWEIHLYCKLIILTSFCNR